MNAETIYNKLMEELRPHIIKKLRSGKKNVIIISLSQSKVEEVTLKEREACRNDNEIWVSTKIKF